MLTALLAATVAAATTPPPRVYLRLDAAPVVASRARGGLGPGGAGVAQEVELGLRLTRAWGVVARFQHVRGLDARAVAAKGATGAPVEWPLHSGGLGLRRAFTLGPLEPWVAALGSFGGGAPPPGIGARAVSGAGAIVEGGVRWRPLHFFALDAGALAAVPVRADGMPTMAGVFLGVALVF